MKKRYFFAIPLLFTSLSGCKYKAPETKYDKVKVALEGVESSFKKIDTNTSNKSSRAMGRVLYAPNKLEEENGLPDSLSFLFTEQNIKGHSVDDLSYTQPPMVQFQCLKKVFDKIGKGFEFGTKYYDNVTGEIYVDFATGFKDETEKAENKYSYDYLLGIDINIDDNDLINADVCFDVNLTKGSERYETVWYVKMVLDYDMDNKTPTYTLNMHTLNDEKELPFFDRYTYENDYVDVKENKINEWRKFCMHSSVKLVKDSAHSSFRDYLGEEGFTYKVDYPKVFVNGNYYKIDRFTGDIELDCGDIYFKDFDCYDLPQKDTFLAKKGTKNNVIQDIYKEFSKLMNEDLAYNIICREEDDQEHNEHNETATITSIRPMSRDGVTGAENYRVGDIEIFSIFNGYVDGEGNKNIIVLWYAGENNSLIEEIRSLDNLEFSFTCAKGSDSRELYPFVNGNKNTKISEAYEAIKEAYNTEDVDEHFFIRVKDNSRNVEGIVLVIYTGQLQEQYDLPEMPKECINLGIPSYEGRNVTYSLKKLEEFEDQDLTYVVDNTNSKELNGYLSKLESSGFVKILNPYTNEYNVYQKNHGERYILFLEVNKSPEFDTSNNTVWIDAYLVPRSTSTTKYSNVPDTLQEIGITELQNSNIKYDHSYYEKEVFYIFNAEEEDIAEFESRYSSSRMKPWVFEKEINGGQNILVLTRKKVFSREYYCYEIEVRENPNYVPPENNNEILEINFLTLAGDFNQWNIDGKEKSYVFDINGNTFNLYSITIQQGEKFKMVANSKWDVSNATTEYGGFGYDDVQNIEEFGDRFTKGENGNIVVNVTITISITGTLSNGVLTFKFH